jgi:hypothetical protein
MRRREPVVWPKPATGVRVEITVRATPEQIGSLPEPQRNAFLVGLGRVMAAAEEGRTLTLLGPSSQVKP